MTQIAILQNTLKLWREQPSYRMLAVLGFYHQAQASEDFSQPIRVMIINFLYAPLSLLFITLHLSIKYQYHYLQSFFLHLLYYQPSHKPPLFHNLLREVFIKRDAKSGWSVGWPCICCERGVTNNNYNYYLKVPRRIVAIEIRQGTSQISRKINFAIWDQICPTLGYFQRTRNVRIRIRAYSEIMISWGRLSTTNTPGHWAFFSAIVLFPWLVGSALISSTR